MVSWAVKQLPLSASYPTGCRAVRGERLLQNLNLEGLAAEQALELLDALLELAHPGGADHLVVDPDRLAAALGHAPSPVEQQDTSKNWVFWTDRGR
jgi:hypothetical protein